MTVLHVKNVGKAYRKYSSEWQRVGRWLGFPAKPQEEAWVLKDINLELEAGKALGLIGQNGAGKSTLLKVITGTLAPTTGSILVNGRFAAMLELGMGFHPELTGRQNAYHAAGLMGFSRNHIESRMEVIERFAEIGEYFDQPVRIYSSGMQARLAFAVATFEVPDVLIVDEVLSVGDSYFQHKSFNRIEQFKEQGVSLIFVSHSMADVKKLCDHAVLLSDGQVMRKGFPDEIVDFYNALIAKKENEKLSVEQRRVKGGWLHTRSGTFEAVIESLDLSDEVTGSKVVTAEVGQRLSLSATVKVKENIPRLVLGYMLKDRLGHLIWGTNTWHTGQTLHSLRKGETVVFKLNFPCALGPGSYSFTPALVSTDTHLVNNYEWADNAIIFDVINSDLHFFAGSSHIDAKFEINMTHVRNEDKK